MAARTSASDREKRYRSRRRDGVIIVPTEVDLAALDALVEAGFVEEADRRDRARIGVGIAGLLEFLAEGALLLDDAMIE